MEKALQAESVRDFERAVSMVSFGCETIEEFYAKSNTRDVIGKVKIPVLFIQSDDGTVPLFSIPRSSIAKNPFTSLLLCSNSPLSLTANGRSAMSWCQNLTIEVIAFSFPSKSLTFLEVLIYDYIHYRWINHMM